MASESNGDISANSSQANKLMDQVTASNGNNNNNISNGRSGANGAINQGASGSGCSGPSTPSTRHSGRSTPDPNQSTAALPSPFNEAAMDLLGMLVPIDEGKDQYWPTTKLMGRYLETIGKIVKDELKQRRGLATDDDVYNLFGEDDFNQQFRLMYDNISKLGDQINAFLEQAHRPELVYPSRVHNKCHKLAAKQLDTAKELFDRGEYIRAAALITQAILYSPDNMDYAGDFAGPPNCHYRNAGQHAVESDRRPDLAEAYYLRAKVFMALGTYLEAIEDLELAANLGHPNQLEMLEMKGQCAVKAGLFFQALRVKGVLEQWCKGYRENKLGKTEKISISTEELIRLEEASDKLARLINETSGGAQSDKRSKVPNRDQEVLPFVRQHHPDFKPTKVDDFATMANGVQFDSLETTRRGMVATRKIKPAEVILVETPLTTLLHPDRDLTYCHHCLTQFLPTLPVYPCSGCALVAYCSGKCRAIDWRRYHSFECSHQALVYELGMFALPLRTMMATGLKTLYYYFMQAAKDPRQVYKPSWCENIRDGHTPPLPEDGWLEHQNGEQIWPKYELLYLDTNFGAYSPEERFNMALVSCLLLEVAKRTNFLYRQLVANFGDEGVGKLSESDLRAWDMWAGALLLRLAYITEANAQPVRYYAYERFNSSGKGCDARLQQVGWGLYMTAARIEHSCGANAIRRYLFGGTCLVQVNHKAINEGEPINVSYCSRQAPYYRRRRWLAKRYRIAECDCSRCKSEMDYLAAATFHFSDKGQFNEQEMWEELRGDFLSDQKVISTCNTNMSAASGEEQQILKDAAEGRSSDSSRSIEDRQNYHHLLIPTPQDVPSRSITSTTPERPNMHNEEEVAPGDAPVTVVKPTHRRYHAHRCNNGRCRVAITGHGHRVGEEDERWQFICPNSDCSYHRRTYVTEQRICEYVKSDFVLAHANSFMMSVEYYLASANWVHFDRYQVVYRLLRMLKNSNLIASTLAVDIARRLLRVAVRLEHFDKVDKLMNIALKHFGEAMGEMAPEYTILQFDELVSLYKRLQRSEGHVAAPVRKHFLSLSHELDNKLAQLAYPHNYDGNLWHDLRTKLSALHKEVKEMQVPMFSFWHSKTKAMKVKGKRLKAAIKVPPPSD